MAHKHKGRPHDPSYTETRWIEPINANTETAADTSSSEKHKNHRKPVTMREDKKTHQHQYRHDHEFREHDNKQH